MHIRAIRTRRFREGENLVSFIRTHIPRVAEGDVIVVTSKIVSLAERRAVSLDRVTKDEWIRRESARRVRTPWCWLTLRDGEWCANAGVDESNADGKLLLLPKDPDASARKIRNALKRAYDISRLGVILSDSRITPLSQGVRGVALAFAGFEGVRDLRGEMDLDGRPLKVTVVNVADALATAAVLEMGEAGESRPLAVIQKVPVAFTQKPTPHTMLRIRPEDDVYRWLYVSVSRGSQKIPRCRRSK